MGDPCPSRGTPSSPPESSTAVDVGQKAAVSVLMAGGTIHVQQGP